MHHHGYLWVGEKSRFDQEGTRRPAPAEPVTGCDPEIVRRHRRAAAEFAVSEVPSIETAHWLLKPAGHIRGTWRNPKDASAWLGSQLVEYAPRFSCRRQQSAAWIADTAASAAERLTCGCDVSLGFYLGRPLFLCLALITCSPNRTAPELLCPAGVVGQ
ncbi:hypothetical protein O3Q52_39715 [Streptomyces sp. ActVer]|uniref:hypothetical protein n=1 Tax=Streptomyces sp. ActVer TaxID=3014558 RepID=UPI0022B46826|nr:hypothetical protein [Streptomyces sp. ActVer]MCZ4514159.1 hypothetical protein [Streptomyces sp. ActVer]